MPSLSAWRQALGTLGRSYRRIAVTRMRRSSAWSFWRSNSDRPTSLASPSGAAAAVSPLSHPVYGLTHQHHWFYLEDDGLGEVYQCRTCPNQRYIRPLE